MSQDIDNVMQAAGRLRRKSIAFPAAQVLDDRDQLVNFALSILPKGTRPVPMETAQHGQRVWVVDGDRVYATDIRVRRNMPEVRIDGMSQDYWWETTHYPVYATCENALLALHWQKMDDLNTTPFAS